MLQTAWTFQLVVIGKSAVVWGRGGYDLGGSSARGALFVLILGCLAACSDGDTANQQVLQPPVQAPNAAPVIMGSPPATATVGALWEFAASASDPDTDALTFAVENPPAWSDFDTMTGRLSGTPTSKDTGNYDDIVISVSDGAASATLAAFSITVIEPTPSGLLALYTFSAGQGDRVSDVSGVGQPLDLIIEDPELVTWLPGGGLELDDVTRIESIAPAEKIAAAVQQSNAFAMEAWVVPLSETQDGPARIVSISQDPFTRNFTLGQVDTALSARFRTSDTSANGRPDLFTSADVVDDALLHVVFTRAADGISRIYKNGNLVVEGMFGGDTSTWDESYKLALGDEVEGGSRPWLGAFRRVALYDVVLSADEVAAQFQAGVDPNNQAPVADFAFSPDGVEGPVTVRFDAGAAGDPDGQIARYAWEFGDGASQETTSPGARHTYTDAGNFTVRLTVRDNDGALATTSRVVSIVEPVGRLANVSWTAPATNVDGSPLTDLASYRVRYGISPEQYTNVVSVDAPLTSTQLTVTGGALYVVVSAVNAAGVESAFSSEVTIETVDLDPA